MLGQAVGRALTASKCFRASYSASFTRVNHFSTSRAILLPRKESQTEASPTGAGSKRRTVSVLEEDPEDLWDAIEDNEDVDDSPSSGHILIQMQRELSHYLTLIEHEMPKLVGMFWAFNGLCFGLNVS